MSGAEFPRPPSRKWSLSPEVSSLRWESQRTLSQVPMHIHSFILSLLSGKAIESLAELDCTISWGPRKRIWNCVLKSASYS